MNIDASLRLSYVLMDHGWSRMDITSDQCSECSCTMMISHLFSCPMEDLCKVAFQLSDNIPELSWMVYDEPQGYKIIFKRTEQHDVYQIIIHELKSSYGDQEKLGQVVFEGVTYRDNLITNIRCELYKTGELLCYPWFAKNKNEAFPRALFKKISV